MTVYLNGDYLPLEEARISPMDRGFLFGDGVYEVIPVYSRRPFRQAEHLARMGFSGAACAAMVRSSYWADRQAETAGVVVNSIDK